MPSCFAISTISCLSRSISGRSSGSSAASSTTARFGSVWEATWPSESPVTSASAPLAPAERRRHLHHQPPLRQHLKPPGAGGGEPALGGAERDDEQPRVALEAVEPAGQRVGLVDRLGPGERSAAEVHEVAAQAALHHPVGGHRRVEPARQEHQRPSARCRPGARRRRAGARPRRAAPCCRPPRTRRGRGSTGPRRARAARAPRRRSRRESSTERSGKRLSRRVVRMAKVRPGRPRSSATAASAAAAASRSQRSAALHDAHARAGARQRPTSSSSRRVLGDDEDAAAMAHLERPEISRQPAQVALERLDEQRPVAALQRELAELEQHAALSANLLHMA